MSYTLLLADDSVTTHRVMELTFAGQGVRVLSVADGEQALERLRSMRPDILLAEVALPRVDGYQLADYVRRTPALAGVPVLLLTGAFDVVDEQRVRECGAVGTIVKPFEPQVVIKRVKELLGISPKTEPAPVSGRLVTSAQPPPQRPPAGPRGVGPPRPPVSVAQPWDELRQQSGLASDNAHVEGSPGGTPDYLDQLDEAFDSLDKQLSGSSGRRTSARPPAQAPEQHPPTATPPLPQQPPRPQVTAPLEDLSKEPPVFEIDHEWFGDTPASHEPPTPVAPATPAAPVAPVAPVHRTEPGAPGAPVAPDSPAAPVHRTEPGAPVAPPAPAAPVHRTEPGAPVAPPAPAAPVYRTEPGAPVAPLAPVAPVAPPAPAAPVHRTEPGAPVAPDAPSAPVHVADAFEALFAQEQGVTPPPPPRATLAISDDVVERIAERVAERLSEGVLLDTVTQIVTPVAERLVREEIARIRAKAEAKRG
jgi:CheY-like chemotaxis protein